MKYALIALALLASPAVAAEKPADPWGMYAIRWYQQCIDRQRPDTLYCERDALRAVSEAKDRLLAEAEAKQAVAGIVPLDDPHAYRLGRAGAQCSRYERIQGCPEPEK
jgi:hypothetical protein